MKCNHEEKGKATWAPTAKVVNGLNEYICNLCGLLHIASKEEEAINLFFTDPLPKPIQFIDHPGPQIFEQAFKVGFGNQKVDVFQKRVRTGSSSAVTYIPKRYVGCAATVIIWRDKEME